MFEREPQIEMQEERGIKGEHIIQAFEEKAFSDFVVNIEKTKQYDANDLNGIDFVWDIKTEKGIQKLAVDVTDPSDERKKLKIKRLTTMPCIHLRDENKKFTSEPIPRILINYRLGYWLMLDEKARQNGKEIYNEQHDSDYAKRIKFIKKAFETEKESLGKMKIAA
ncbi:MAG: hypothetical protein HY219_01270 [Candidatus Staskawiczbacteria bacterium]|nr:hypothetical protein [Candidatus Staskawiczbacteria bacterium]